MAVTKVEVDGITHRSVAARFVHQLLDSTDRVGQVYACVDKQAVVANK
ncbi:hypothetical protein [Thaumasiovibrio subtropicus]|nr:hypothetical protein [Thaumasiovibrio subtropicus]